jgi:5-methylcytosine-specific restriction protein A
MGWRHKASRHARGYGGAWERLRKAILIRDGFACQVCKQQGVLCAATQVDHIIPKSRGGTDERDNLQAICGSCHKQKTARESNPASYDKHMRRGCSADGTPMDVSHHWNR